MTPHCRDGEIVAPAAAGPPTLHTRGRSWGEMPEKGAAGAGGASGEGGGVLERAVLGVVAAQDLGPPPDRRFAGEVPPPGDAQPRAAAPAWLLGDPQSHAVEPHDMVAPHQPLAVLGEEL